MPSYTTRGIINIHKMLQGVLSVHTKKFKMFVVFDTVISATNMYHKKVQSLTEGFLYRDYYGLVLYSIFLLGEYGMLSFRRMDKNWACICSETLYNC